MMKQYTFLRGKSSRATMSAAIVICRTRRHVNNVSRYCKKSKYIIHLPTINIRWLVFLCPETRKRETLASPSPSDVIA